MAEKNKTTIPAEPKPLDWDSWTAGKKSGWTASLKAGTGKLVAIGGRQVWVPEASSSSSKKLSLAEWRALDPDEQLKQGGRIDPSAHMPGQLTPQEKARLAAHSKAVRKAAAIAAAKTKRGG